MSEFHHTHLLWLALTVLVVWRLPVRHHADAIMASTMALLAWFSPLSLALLLTSSLLVYGLASQRRLPRHVAVMAGSGYVVAQFLLVRLWEMGSLPTTLQMPLVIGLAYYSCRHIHYLIEVYKGHVTPVLRDYLRYQFFLPVMLAGPIHRYGPFHRQCDRRRWDPALMSEGIERVLYGYVKVVVLGNYVVLKELQSWHARLELTGFADAWLSSALDWSYLYLQFSGWSDVAIGFALLMGFRVEENFNRPFLATSLVEFWQRWHMTLSFWCRDYVFKPLMAATRRPLLAIVATMVTLGAWHELSLYYLLWGAYHALGIAAAHRFRQWRVARLPALGESRAWAVVAWALTINFVIGGMPVIGAVEEWMRGLA